MVWVVVTLVTVRVIATDCEVSFLSCAVIYLFILVVNTDMLPLIISDWIKHLKNSDGTR